MTKYASSDSDIQSSSDNATANGSPNHESTERIFRLLQFLAANNCTRQDIFERMRDYYKINEGDDPRAMASSQRAGRMLLRDIQFLEKMGYRVNKTRSGNTTRYNLAEGSGPASPFLFNQTELDTLALLHTLFADPAKYAQSNAAQPLPTQPPRNPFAEGILSLIERLIATLPPEQKKYFDRWVRKPFIYFNLDTVTNYLPHRATIDTIVRYISQRQQIHFEYASMQRRQGTTLHEHVDPYYIIHQDGHLYLIGYSHKMNTFFEYRIDRIKAESLKPEHEMIDGERRRVKKPTSTNRATRNAGCLCAQKPTATGVSSSNYTSMATKPNSSIPPSYANVCGRKWRGCTACIKNKARTVDETL